MLIYYILSYGSMIILIPGLLLSIYAQIRVKTTYARYSKKYAFSAVTGADAARTILRQEGVNGVVIQQISGDLTDNYNPKSKVLNLSSTYHSSSIAAIGVAAHEAGHAIQDDKNYFPLKLRSFLVPAVNIGSFLAVPLAIIGVIIEWLSEVGGAGTYVLYAGIILYSLTTVFSLITLPVEFNASRRAVAAIQEAGILSKSELKDAKKVLYSAALTYVAALVVSFLYLVRFLFLIASLRRRDR